MHAADILLIGGNSGSGKTRLAAAIGRLRGSAWAQVDDFRLALQRLTSEETHPDLHFFLRKGVWQRTPEQLRDGLIGVATIVCDALEVVVGHHFATSIPLVLEGDAITPAFAAGPALSGRVQAAFLIEPEASIIAENLWARGRGFHARPARERQAQIEMNRLFGEWLRTEAEARGLPVVAPRPYETLADRFSAALSG